MEKKKEKNLNKEKKGLNVFISNFTRVLLILIFIRGWIKGDHSQDPVIVITFILTLSKHIREKIWSIFAKEVAINNYIIYICSSNFR